MTEIPPRPPKYPKPKKHGSLILSKSLQWSNLWIGLGCPSSSSEILALQEVKKIQFTLFSTLFVSLIWWTVISQNYQC